MPFESKLLDTLEDMDDDHYHKKACEEDPKIAYKASLQLIFAHMADFHIYILDCIARRYGHTRDELVDTIRGSPGWNTLYIHPVLKEFTNNLHLSSRYDVMPAEEAPAEPVKVVRRRKVKVPEPEPEPEEEVAAPKKKIIRPKLPLVANSEEVAPEPKILKKKKQVQRKPENE
jgi:hypothetical protein